MEGAQRSGTKTEVIFLGLTEDQNRTVEISQICVCRQLPHSVDEIEGLDDEHWPLSGRPFCSVVLSKTYVKPVYNLHFPLHMRPNLPEGTTRLVIKYGRKEWQGTYCSEGITSNVIGGWNAFVDDNSLKVGDAVVFELLHACPEMIKFRAQILRGDIPPELKKEMQLKKKMEGSSSNF